MEKYFKDVVAIGYAVFMPHEQILSPKEAIKDEPINGNDHALEDHWMPYAKYLTNTRINVNVRQVFPKGFNPSEKSEPVDEGTPTQ